jgi:sensor histidine kinase regulating citrate/malate metabolism
MIQKIKDVYAQPADTVSRIQAIVAQGDPVKGEEIAMCDGRVYLVDYIPIHIEGKTYGRLWHHQDITERKLLEDRLRKEILEREKSG